MKINLTTLLSVLPGIGPIAAAVPAFKQLYDEIVETLHPDDQDTARSAYEDLIADNKEGTERLRAKLAAAAQR